MVYRSPSVDGHKPVDTEAAARSRETNIPAVESAPPESVHSEDSDSDDASSQYRTLPLFAGMAVPFCILLAVPSLTTRWYVRTGEKNVVIESRPNSTLLRAAMIVTFVCAVLANVCLVVHFTERAVKAMTWLSVALLTIHDVINIVTLSLFAYKHRFDDGFTYGQPFWMTVCSTVISTFTNVALIIDLFRMSKFTSKPRSGLTRKQRTLVIVVIILLIYVAFGALVQCFMLKLSFIDALYFTVATIEAVGFGDIVPASTGSRIFTVFYISVGILNIAVAVTVAREAILEGIVVTLQHRIRGVRRRERDRRLHARWRDAIEWRLRAQNVPVWIDGPEGRRVWSWKDCATYIRAVFGRHEDRHANHQVSRRRPWRRRRLNLEALTREQLEAAAFEAGALSLSALLPPDFDPPDSANSAGEKRTLYPGNRRQRLHPPLTHTRVGGMVRLMTSLAHVVTYGEHALRDWSLEDIDEDTMVQSDDASLRVMLESEAKLAFRVRLAVAITLFLGFWLIGSAIFSRTEGWSFASAAYFCFITFTTVGYGDLSPKTPAGRSIFVAWALLGIATMTILLSILAEAYSSSYKQVVHVYEGDASVVGNPTHASAVPKEGEAVPLNRSLVEIRIRDMKQLIEDSAKAEADADTMRTLLDDINKRLSELDGLVKDSEPAVL